MDNKNCKNIENCRLVVALDFKIEKSKREEYLEKFCTSGIENWSKCKRYTTKAALNFCPDFVMPDTPLTPDEIIEKFDQDDTLV